MCDVWLKFVIVNLFVSFVFFVDCVLFLIVFFAFRRVVVASRLKFSLMFVCLCVCYCCV